MIVNGKLIIPKAKRDSGNLEIDISKIHEVEDRIPEIQRATPTTLPELIVVFTMGMLQVSRMLSLVELETKAAKRLMDESESIALLERIEGILEQKKVKSSVDTRKAAITLDADYKDAREKYDMLTSISSLLNGKLNAIQNAYFGAKKICDIFIKVPTSTTYGGSEHEN